MCGIVGVFGQITPVIREAFLEMLHYDAVRGWDSTGIFNVQANHQSMSYKLAEVPTEFLKRSGAQAVLRTASTALVGHNRAATRGGISDDNAHPFTHGTLTGVHNGTLRNQHSLPDSTKFPVDSDNLIYAIQRDGIEPTLRKVQGAYALVMYDEANTGVVQIIRNSERPLYFCTTEDGKTTFIASEYHHIAAATMNSRAKLKMKTNEKGACFFSFKEDMLYEVNLSTAEVTEVREIKPERFQETYTYNNRYSATDTWHAKATAAEKKILDLAEAKIGGTYTYIFDSFNVYQASVSGTLRGYSADRCHQVQIFGTPQHIADKIKAKGSFTAEITAASEYYNKDVQDAADCVLTAKNPQPVDLSWKRAVLVENGVVVEVDFFTSEVQDPWFFSESAELGAKFHHPKYLPQTVDSTVVQLSRALQ